MDFGQIRTGDSDDDTYVKMLQQVTRVTESVAGGIANQYPNVFSLVTAFKKHGPLMLEDLTVSSALSKLSVNNLTGSRNGSMRMAPVQKLE